MWALPLQAHGCSVQPCASYETTRGYRVQPFVRTPAGSRARTGDVARQHRGPGPRGRVQRRPGCGTGTRRAGDDQDLALAPLDHRRHRRLEEVVWRLEATADHLLQVVERRVREATGDDPPGGGDRRVDPSEAVESGGEQSGRRLGAG